MELILIRHGETDWNKEGKLLSKTNIPLNKKGIEQAKKVAIKLKKKQINLIISSPLKRAIQTAKEINKFHNKQIIIDENLKERNYGKFEGENYFKINLIKIRDNNLYKKYNMETPEEFENRIKLFLKNNFLKKYNQKIIIISHSGTIKMILYHLLKINESFEIFRKKINKSNASISTIKFNNKLEIIDFNIANNEHLI